MYSKVNSDSGQRTADGGQLSVVIFFSLILVLLSSLPYIVGYRAQTDEMIFSGAVFNRLDVDVYLASMQAGAAGDWTYHLRFTSEPHQGVYAKLTYVVLGHVARWFQLPIPVAYHVFRLLFGLLASLAVYALMAQIFADLFWRRLAFVWALIGSGGGWLQLLFGWLPQPDISPMDFWLNDPYPYFGMLVVPHFSLTTALLAGMLALFLSHLRQPAGWKVAAIAAFGVLTQLVQSYAPLLADLGMAGAALAVMLQVRRIDWKVITALGVVALSQIPLLVYGVRAFLFDPFWSEFARHNINLSPPPVYYLWGFAFLWLPALVGLWVVFASCLARGALAQGARSARVSTSLAPARSARREEAVALSGAQRCQDAGLAAAFWLIGVLILAYLPWGLQRRFTHALMLPLTILAVTGLLVWEGRSKPMARRTAMLLVGLSAISSLYLTFGLGLYVAGQPADLFDPAPLVEAVDWLSEHATSDDVVLSAPRSGQLLAARGGVVAYIGHPMEMLFYEQKAPLVTAFYRGEASLAELPACGCDWLLIGPYERALGAGDGPPGAVLAYRRDDVAIYRLVNP